MSERAAAAEARRLKILARGRDRLSAITVGSIAGWGAVMLRLISIPVCHV